MQKKRKTIAQHLNPNYITVIKAKINKKKSTNQIGAPEEAPLVQFTFRTKRYYWI